MREVSRRFLTNAEILSGDESPSYCAADGSSFIVESLQLEPLITLARGIVEVLNNGRNVDLSNGRFDFLRTEDLREARQRSRRKTRKRSIVLMDVEPADGLFSVRVEQYRSGTKKLTASTTTSWEKLQASYGQVMEAVTLDPSWDESMENVLAAISKDVKTTGSTGSRKSINEQRESDLLSAPDTLKLLGVKPDVIEEDKNRLLIELWQDRSLDKVALVDLFLRVVEEKQKIGRDDFPQVGLTDLAETGRHIAASDLRGEQQKNAAELFTDLGFDPQDIERRFINADKDRALAYRYAAWLMNQEFMDVFRDDTAKILAQGKNISSAQLFVDTTTAVFDAYKVCKENSDDKYNLSIGWQTRARATELEFLKTCALLCMNIFFEKDISRLVQDR